MPSRLQEVKRSGRELDRNPRNGSHPVSLMGLMRDCNRAC